MPEQLRIVTKYEAGDAVIMADLAGDGDVKRIQHYIFEELYLQGKLDLSDASTKGIKEFEIPISQAESYVNMQLNADVYSDGMGVFDLRAVPYHGGTTFSSGALPKWDIGDMFIKVCTLSPSGRWQTDAAHEAYAMDLFKDTGVVVADAVPGYALFYNKDTRQDEVRFCEVARKFSGLLSKVRLKHNRRVVEGRVAECLEIFS